MVDGAKGTGIGWNKIGKKEPRIGPAVQHEHTEVEAELARR